MDHGKVGCFATNTVGNSDNPMRCCWSSVYQQSADLHHALPSVEDRMSAFPMYVPGLSNSASVPCPCSTRAVDGSMTRNLIPSSCSTMARTKLKMEPDNVMYVCRSCQSFNRVPSFDNIFEFTGTTRKFRATVVDDLMTKGMPSNLQLRYQSITTMPEYENKSFEELRLEDYFNNRISPSPKSDLKSASQNPLIESLIRCANVEYGQNDVSKTAIKGEDTSLLEILLNAVRDRMNFRFVSEEAKHACEQLTQKLTEFTEKTLENLTVVILEDMLHHLKQKNADNYDKLIKKSSRIREPKKHNSNNHKKVRSTRKLGRQLSKDDRRQSSCNKYESSGLGDAFSCPSIASSSCEDRDSEKNDSFHTSIARKKIRPKCWRKYGYDCSKFDGCCEPYMNDEFNRVQKAKVKSRPLSKYGTDKSSTKCFIHRRRRNEKCSKSNFDSKVRARNDERHVYELLKSISVDDKPRTSNRKQQKTVSEGSTVTSEESDDNLASEASVFPIEKSNSNFKSNVDRNNDYTDSSSSV